MVRSLERVRKLFESTVERREFEGEGETWTISQESDNFSIISSGLLIVTERTRGETTDDA